MSLKSLEAKLRERIDTAINAQFFPGCVIGILTKEETCFVAGGRHTYSSDSPAVTKDSLYDCASITKSIPLATLVLQLIEEEKLSLDARLIDFIPEFDTRHRNAVHIRHLLTYTLGNTVPLSQYAHLSGDEIFQAVCHEEMHEPGTIFSYSNTPALLLGIVIERIEGKKLDAIAHERIFSSLKMTQSTFHPRGAVPTEENIRDIVHDPSARVFAREARTVGHAGLFSTASDLLTFMHQFLDGRLSHQELATNQIPDLGSCGLGWELDQEWMGRGRSRRTFGKTGFTGTSVLYNPKLAVAIVILSNRTYPDPGDRARVTAFRAEIADHIFETISAGV